MRKIVILVILFLSILQGGGFCTKEDSNIKIKKILKVHSDVDCMLILSNRYMKEGKLSSGFYYLSKAYKLNPQKVRNDKSSKVLSLALNLTKLEIDAKKNQNIKSWNKIGDIYFDMKVFAEAKRAYQNSLKIKPTQIKIRILFAITLQALKQHYRALIELEKVLKSDKNNVRANYYIGKIFKNNIGDFVKAKKHFKFVIKILQKSNYGLKKGEAQFFMEDSKKELQSLKGKKNEE